MAERDAWQNGMGRVIEMRALIHIVAATGFALAAIATVTLVAVPRVSADDDGGGGGGDGGSGGAGGGDPWSPKFRSSAPKKSQCFCLPFIACSCNARPKSKPQRYVEKPVRQPAPQPRQELLITNLPPDARAILERRGYTVRGERMSSLAGATITRVVAPIGEGRQAAMNQIQRLAPNSLVTRDDKFRRLALSFRPAGVRCGRQCEPFQVTAWTERIGQCSAGARLGVVDTGVDLQHPSLVAADVHVNTVRSSDRKASDRDHGTAVVSLLVGQAGSEVQGLSPAARVYAADAFHNTSFGSTADAFDLIAALDWLVEQNVQAINLSLSGPDNMIIKKAISEVIARKIAIVAAAGKPTEEMDKTGYPARYEGVIAVSSVDSRLRPSRLSIRGNHIAFSAPGVGISVASSGAQTKLADGTSFAAPFVTAAYAAMLKGGATTNSATEKIAAAAKDLGTVGRDPIYGWGLVQFDGLPDCR